MIDKDNIYPLVSVVVPIYNMECFISETLDSILASDYPNFEVIAYDDGSKDSSLSIILEYAEKDNRVRAFSHENSGVSITRNRAVTEAKGEYILPVDADDLIEKNFISEAVKAISVSSDIKVVNSRADFFGAKTGEWFFPNYSFELLARKNIICVCALYRKTDWERVGGYCEELPTREDWVFWVSILKDGGEVIKLPFIALHYRVREGSKRIADRVFKTKVIDLLNRNHIDMYARLFGGPLRYNRTYSRLINKIDNIFNRRRVVVSESFSELKNEMELLHWRFNTNWGKVIHKSRNELREVEIGGKFYIVKRYALQNFINRIVYDFIRASKAERAFKNAQNFLKEGIGTPEPVAFITRKLGFLLLKESYFISEKSPCTNTFNEIINDTEYLDRNKYIVSLGQQTAIMHEKGFYPLDYSGGNILFEIKDGNPIWQQVDLNRMYFGEIDMIKGCKGFCRINLEPDALEIIARAYAVQRGFDEEKCVELVKKYRWRKHKTRL